MNLFAKTEVRTLALGGVVVAAVAGAAWWALSGGTGASAQSNAPRERVIAVAVAKAMRKDVPYRVDAPGAVQPMVSVTVRARIDTQVESVAFQDGAAVKEGDVLFKLDARAVDAQIRQAEAQIARDQAALVKAKRDVERYAGLVGRGSISQVTLDDARTNTDVLAATVKQNEASLDNLRAQRTYYDVLSPATGRVGIAGVRAGAVVKSGDLLATVNQMSPIYVAFGVPERYIPDLRAAGSNATVDAALQNGVTASRRLGRLHRQHGRSTDRHHHGARAVRQQGRAAVAGHAGERAPYAARRSERGRGAERGGAERPARHLRVRGRKQRRARCAK